MKLLRCYVENFGKLSDFRYEFEDGLNVINENNGFGKTTFANFIKAMFYGLESTARRTTALTDRKKYMPWQGGNFGGNIEFEINNNKYKIERYFGKKDSEDIFRLYDLKTNLESKDFTENIGEEIFKINKEAYERSTYIPQQNLKIQMNDSINAKLGNVLESENDVNTSEVAIKKLSDSMKKYKKTGNRGLIDIAEKNIENLEKKIELTKLEENNIDEKKEKLNKIINEIKEKEEEKKQIQKNITIIIDLKRKDAKKETYQTIKNNYELANQKYNEAKQFFNGEIPEDEEIDVLIDKCLEVEKYKVEFENYGISEEEKNNLERLNNLFKNKEIDENIIKQNIADYNEIKDIIKKMDMTELNKEHIVKESDQIKEKINKNKKANIILIVFTILCIIVSVGIILTLSQKKLLGAIPVCIAIILGIIILVKNNNRASLKKSLNDKILESGELDETNEGLKEKKIKLESSVKHFIEEFSDNKNEEDILIKLTEIKSDFNKYIDLNNNFNNILEKQFLTKSKLELLEDSIKEYILKYFKEINKPYTKLSEDIKIRKQELNAVKIDFEEKKKQKEEYEKNNDVNELNIDNNAKEQKEDNITKEELEGNLIKLDEKINILNDEKNYLKNQIEKIENEIDENIDLEQELMEEKEKLLNLENRYKVIENTKKILEKAKEQFSSHYLNDMIDGFNKYIKLINKEEIVSNIDVNLNTKIEYKGSKKDIDFLSTGYKDLIYICMRFSLIRALYKDECPFVILDDPFVNLDKEKTENAIKLIKELSKEYQIIYFICHNSRA